LAPQTPTTRLAPSPTGALHLGNAYAFLVTWALARRSGWRVVLRIEDLDGPRVKWGSADDIIDTLRWLGIDWDEGPSFQTADLAPYQRAISDLAARGLAYPSDLTRTQIDAAAGAPQEGSGESRFPSSLRPSGWDTPRTFTDQGTNWRFATPDRVVTFADTVAGEQAINPSQTIGDFVLWTKRSVPAYQLAVVVDDARQGVTEVVRGDDLLDSAARQMLLYEALNAAPLPRYTHLPLVVGPDGRRLAKRHGDSRVDYYRGKGVPPQAITGLVACWCGAVPNPRPMTAVEFTAAFDLSRIPRSLRYFTPKEDAWLLSQA
jgi:glutamyl-tRNA synthetase